jgi:hypothetical protein
MSSALRFLITLFRILWCTTIARAATQESCAGIVFEKASVHEGAIGFFGSFNVANTGATFSGTVKPWTKGATPNSIYTHIFRAINYRQSGALCHPAFNHTLHLGND